MDPVQGPTLMTSSPTDPQYHHRGALPHETWGTQTFHPQLSDGGSGHRGGGGPALPAGLAVTTSAALCSAPVIRDPVHAL